MIQLTKQKNDFREPLVYFTRYELLRLLGWPNEGKSYHRLGESLKRWHGVTLNYQGCWWDKRAGRWGDADIHIIESVVILDGSAEGTDGDARRSLPLSSFEWNKRFIESCQAGNLKHLDLTLYFSLEHPSSKRLYRFLDKRFYLQPEWLFDLTEIAFERVGLSRNYADAGKIKEKLQPAIDELEGRGFLQPMGRDERYVKEGKAWRVRFIRQPPAPATPPQARAAAELEPPLVAALIERGVTRTTAAELVERHPAETIGAKIDVFDWMAGKQDKRLARSPAGYLVKSITDDYAPPRSYVGREERQAREEARQARERQGAEDRRRRQEQATRERALREKVDAYIERLTPAERQALEAEALAHADSEARRACEEAGPARLRAALRLGLLREHAARELSRVAGLASETP
jgi:hypothetical protein